MIEAGERAPGFTLRDQDGVKVSLGDFDGRRVLLAFFPLAFSPACGDQLELYQQRMDEIDATGVKLMAVSVDHNYSLRAFADKLGLTMTLLSDFKPKGEVARAYGAFISKRDHSNRSLVLIGKEGTVEWVHEAASTLEIPPPDLVLSAAAAA